MKITIFLQTMAMARKDKAMEWKGNEREGMT
jgi:hypothetical protein